MIGLLIAGASIASTPMLGKAEGACRDPETGPAFLVEAVGLKDRQGQLRLELYPARDGDFLGDDNVLVEAGKSFARVDIPVPKTGRVRLCIRAPHAGSYAMALLHDRNANMKFDLSSDGIGFPGNPRLGWSKPKAAQATATVGAAPASIEIRLNYRHGLFMRPEEAE